MVQPLYPSSGNALYHCRSRRSMDAHGQRLALLAILLLCRSHAVVLPFDLPPARRLHRPPSPDARPRGAGRSTVGTRDPACPLSFYLPARWRSGCARSPGVPSPRVSCCRVDIRVPYCTGRRSSRQDRLSARTLHNLLSAERRLRSIGRAYFDFIEVRQLAHISTVVGDAVIFESIRHLVTFINNNIAF